MYETVFTIEQYFIFLPCSLFFNKKVFKIKIEGIHHIVFYIKNNCLNIEIARFNVFKNIYLSTKYMEY